MRFTVILVALLTLLIIAPLSYMIADNEPPYEFDAERSYVVPSKTPAGHQIVVHWHIIKINRVCPGSITRYIVDDETKAKISYDAVPSARQVEFGTRELNRTFLLPFGIHPGKKWYYSEGEYACNLLQRFYPLRVLTPRISFEVTE